MYLLADPVPTIELTLSPQLAELLARLFGFFAFHFVGITLCVLTGPFISFNRNR